MVIFNENRRGTFDETFSFTETRMNHPIKKIVVLRDVFQTLRRRITLTEFIVTGCSLFMVKRLKPYGWSYVSSGVPFFVVLIGVK